MKIKNKKTGKVMVKKIKPATRKKFPKYPKYA